MSTIERNAIQTPESADVKTVEVCRLKQEYQVLQERHRLLDSIVPQWEECTGIFQEMSRLEKSMKTIRERLEQLEGCRKEA